VRSPETFLLPDEPIIMLTGHGDRPRVVEGCGWAVNKFPVKPVSSRALLARLVSISSSRAAW